MVCFTEKPSFRLASCWSVEVVNGAAGFFFPGLVSSEVILNSAPFSSVRKLCASSWVLNFVGHSAIKITSPSRTNSAFTLKVELPSKSRISRSRSTITRTATDCTRPADRPALIFFQRTGESSYPTRRSSTRRACWASTRC